MSDVVYYRSRLTPSNIWAVWQGQWYYHDHRGDGAWLLCPNDATGPYDDDQRITHLYARLKKNLKFDKVLPIRE